MSLRSGLLRIGLRPERPDYRPHIILDDLGRGMLHSELCQSSGFLGPIRLGLRILWCPVSLKDLIIRPITPGDSLAELTELIHRAYARLGATGLNYTAVDQSVEDTARRISRGECAVAICSGRIVGTITVGGHEQDSRCEWYRGEQVAIANQFAVEPSLQGQGLGSMLLDWAEKWARERTLDELAVDTAEPATHLVAFYTKRGYRNIGFIQWKGKRYRSVVLSKTLSEKTS